MARRLTRATTIAAGALGASAAFVVGGLALTGAISPLGERAFNRVHRRGPYRASPRAVELHRSLTVVDLHADSLLWGRDLRRRASYGHLDIPRLIDGGVALVGLSAATQVPLGANMDRNDARPDLVTVLALGQRWPRPTWGSRLARALHLALRLREMAADSAGRLDDHRNPRRPGHLPRPTRYRSIAHCGLPQRGGRAGARRRSRQPRHPQRGGVPDTRAEPSARHGLCRFCAWRDQGGVERAGSRAPVARRVGGPPRGRRPRVLGHDRRRPQPGRSAGACLPHGCPRRRSRRPQPGRRSRPRDRGNRRARRDRILAAGVRRP